MMRTLPAAIASIVVGLLAVQPALGQEPSSEVTEAVINFPISLRRANVDAEARHYLVNLDDCRDLVANRDDDITFTWTFSRSGPSDALYTIKLRQDSETCNLSSLITETNDECLTLEQQESFANADSIGHSYTWQELSGFDDRADCTSSSLVIDLALIFTSLSTSTSDTDDDTDKDVTRLEMVTVRPPAPSDIVAEAGESSLRVDWSEVSSAEAYDVYYSTTEFEAGADPDTLDADQEQTNSESIEIDEGLALNTIYYIGVSTIDDVGNASLISDVVTVETQPVIDFYEHYRGVGGVEEGGYCNLVATRPMLPTRPGSVLLWLSIGAFVVVSRRRSCRGRRGRWRRGTVAVMALALVLGLAIPLAAEEVQSPIHGEFEIKFGGYRPDIDSEFEGSSSSPYSRIFGSGSSFYVEGELDHYLWREWGAFALGFSVGYMSESGQGLLTDGSSSVDETSLSLVPMRLSAVYRFDMLTRDLSIPLVPYAKAGFDYYFWWIESAAGIATYRDRVTDQLDEGRGGIWGYHWSIGIQFLLDVLAPQMSRTFDAGTGVNNSYLFVEGLWSRVDNFGSDNHFQLGDTSVLFGLAFEY